MRRPSSMLLSLSLSLFALTLSACVLSNDAAEVGAGPERPSSIEPGPGEEVTEAERPDLSTGAGLFGITHPDDTPTDVTLADGLESVMLGDFSCVGRNLPAVPSGATRTLGGRTVHFGTDIAAPGTNVLLLAADGSELADVVSDDRGLFEASVPDTAESSVTSAIVSRPGYDSVRYTPTHPGLAFSGNVALGVVKPSDLTLIEAVAGVEVDESRGSVVVRVFDCAGSGDVAGAHVAIEGAPVDVYYSSNRFEVSRDLERTSTTGHAYLFNLEPGVYTVAVWGFVGPGPDNVALLNRAVVEVEAGSLTVADVYPE